MKLYHGTDADAKKSIDADGFINGPVFLTPCRDTAEWYGGGDDSVIIEVIVDEADLLIDFDLPGQRLMTVEDANQYTGNDGWTIDDYLNDGQSVATPSNSQHFLR
jgi:hypothetical protein